ncbi:Site-specific recombinase XerD [Mariprofundus ferrinatatus]|uniref:Site-specific recombinase XerD n=1 Tax=Mariprofundus ferrinatatus TaxID=1921087 RepID=A0A2K8L3T3_9PROT|nr:tyrosine-type recombinase/integrase [Mariprofundus ferrinatatus]ATX81995.1 Site-specific recombinase XerD [Mariprofundus ferrinatatus]
MIDEIIKKFDGAFAENTIRAYRSDFIQFELWCRSKGKEPIPTDAETLAQYVDEMSLTLKSATIRRRIASLCSIFKLSRNPDPTNDPEVILALKRMHRRIGRAQEQAAPLTRDILEQMLATCDGSLIGQRNRVMLLLGYETMRRRSEICDFKFEDVTILPNKQTAIRLNFSKTDQYGEGKVIPISRELYDTILNWKESIAATDGYILRRINRHGQVGDHLSPSSISKLLKEIQQQAFQHIERELSGHSFRVGAALDLLNDGYGLEKIMLRGGWRTESTALRYLRTWSEI